MRGGTTLKPSSEGKSALPRGKTGSLKSAKGLTHSVLSAIHRGVGGAYMTIWNCDLYTPVWQTTVPISLKATYRFKHNVGDTVRCTLTR